MVAQVERWVTSMARSDWQAAASFIEMPNHYGVRWTETDVRRALAEYRPGQPEPSFTAPGQMIGAGRTSVVAFRDGTGYSVDYALPLDGTWSDLTAQFEFQRIGGEFFATLHDLHVL